MQKTIPLSDVVPNPFRHMDRYPIKEDKIITLTESMGRTGFWDNVVARKVGKKYELAYGHHRWIAFKRKYGDDASITLIVKDLSDEDMLRVMADENMAEFGTSAEIEQETVRAVVLAYAEGRIKSIDEGGSFPKVDKKTNVNHIRYAPSFRRGCSLESKEHSYTAETIADFLGWKQPDGQPSTRIRNALAALEAIEEEVVDEEDVVGMSSDQAKTIVNGARRINEEYEGAAMQAGDEEKAEKVRQKGKGIAREAAKKTAEKIRSKEGTVRTTQETMRQERDKARAEVKKIKIPPSVVEFAGRLARDLMKILSVRDPNWAKISELIRYRKEIDQEDLQPVIDALETLSNQCLGIISSLKQDRSRLE